MIEVSESVEGFQILLEVSERIFSCPELMVVGVKE